MMILKNWALFTNDSQEQILKLNQKGEEYLDQVGYPQEALPTRAGVK